MYLFVDVAQDHRCIVRAYVAFLKDRIGETTLPLEAFYDLYRVNRVFFDAKEPVMGKQTVLAMSTISSLTRFSA